MNITNKWIREHNQLILIISQCKTNFKTFYVYYFNKTNQQVCSTCVLHKRGSSNYNSKHNAWLLSGHYLIRFESHQAAVQYYTKRSLRFRLPNNHNSKKYPINTNNKLNVCDWFQKQRQTTII